MGSGSLQAMEQPAGTTHPALARVVYAACVGALGLAVSALLSRVQLLPGGLPAPAMNQVTALCVVLASGSLALLAPPSPGPAALWGARALAAAVAGIAGSRWISYLVGRELTLDEFLFGARFASAPARMGTHTAIALTSVGTALITLDFRTPRGWRLADPLLYLGLAVSLAALAGYFYTAESMHGIMSAQTSIAVMLLCAGALLARPDRGLMGLLLSSSPGGEMARRMLPVAVILPFALGWVRLAGQRAGLYGLAIGTTLLVLAIVAAMVGLVWMTGRRLDRSDRERQRAETFVDSIIENLPMMVFVKDAHDLKFVRMNRAGEDLLGLRREQLLGKSDYDFFPREEADFFTSKDRAVLASKSELDIPEEPIQTALQGMRTLHTKKVPILDANGTPLYLLGISEDITEKKRAEREIADLNEGARQRRAELEAANQELEAFSYSVSHDLRAPVRHLDGFSDLLMQHARGTLDEKGMRYLTTISASAKNMGRLIDDLLALSRMGRTQMQSDAVDLDRLVHEVRSELDGADPARRVEWRIGPLPTVRGDRGFLKLAFMNLLANAVKYSRRRESAVVEIGARTADAEDVIHVRDNGVGFDMKYQHKLFGVFQRLHRDDEFEGTGIGLATVRRIVSRHGGRTWAEGALDQGATFYVALPRTSQKEHVEAA